MHLPKLTPQNPSHNVDYNVRGMNPARLAAIERYAGREVLDVGCGNGAYVLHLADRLNIRGVDYQRFESWSLHPELFAISDAQELTLPDEAVDTILSFETLEHLQDPKRALREYRRVCRKNLILTVPNCALTPGMRSSGLIFNHWIDRTHINFWDLDAICALAVDCGFAIQSAQHINQINLVPLLQEALGLRGLPAKIGKSLFRLRRKREYPMTCLVVAEKKVSDTHHER